MEPTHDAAGLFDWRGFQLDLARQPEREDEIIRLIRQSARFGFNRCVLYLENAIALPAFGAAADRDALTREACRRIQDSAREVGVEVAPALNLLGHMERLLAHPDFSALRETRSGNRRRDQAFNGDLCPSLPRSRELAAAAIRETAEIFDSDLLHVGLDETYTLGACPLCRRREIETGLGRLFVEWVEFLHQEVTRAGKRMGMWADMFFIYRNIPWERVPRDIMMFPWYYFHVPHLPGIDFFSWRRVDELRQLHQLGFEMILGGGLSVTATESLLRYACGVPLAGWLVTQWEGSNTLQEVYAASRFSLGRLLKTGRRPAAIELGNELLPDSPTPPVVGGMLLLRAEALIGMWPEPFSAGQLSYSVESGAVRQLQAARELLDAWNLLEVSSLASILKLELLRRAFESGRTVLLNEAALVARQMAGAVVKGFAAIRLRDIQDLTQRAWTEGRQLAAQLEEGARKGLERRRVLTWWTDREAAFHLLEGQVQQVLGGANPFTGAVLAIEMAAVDWITHEVEIAVASPGAPLKRVFHTCNAPVQPEGKTVLAVELPSCPDRVRLRVGGYGRLCVTVVRLENAAGTRLPRALARVEGNVLHPEHLLAWDDRYALFNEADVEAKWNDPQSDRIHAVTLQF